MPFQFQGLSPEDWFVAAAVFGAAVAAFPVVCTALGLTRQRYVAIDDPNPVHPDARPDDSDYRQKFKRFASVGFEPAGWIREESWLFMHHYYKAFRVYCLRSPDGSVYATLYQIAPGERWRMALDTFTDAGAMVRTVAPGGGLEMAFAGFSRKEYAVADPDRLLHLHADHVADAVPSLGGEVTAVALADRAAIDLRTERRLMAEAGISSGWGVLFMGLAMPAITMLIAMDWLPIGPDTARGRVAVSFTFGAVFYLAFVLFLFPLIVAGEGDKDAAID